MYNVVSQSQVWALLLSLPHVVVHAELRPALLLWLLRVCQDNQVVEDMDRHTTLRTKEAAVVRKELIEQVGSGAEFCTR